MNLSKSLRSRPTPEIAILLLTGTICVILLAGAVGIIVLTAVRPEYDTSQIVAAEAEILTVLVGAIVGYIAGRGQSAITTLEELGGPPAPPRPPGDI